MVYITSRRDQDRTSGSIDVKVYSNCPKVTVKINGQSIGGVRTVSDHVFVLKGVPLVVGDNTVEVEGQANDRTVRDSCIWRYREIANTPSEGRPVAVNEPR